MLNHVLVGQLPYSLISKISANLETFCEGFLSCTCCEEHVVATKLAKLAIFLFCRPYFRDDYDPGKGLQDEEPNSMLPILQEGADKEDHQIRQELEREGRTITPATPINFHFLRADFDENGLKERYRAGIPRFNLEFAGLWRRQMIIPFRGFLSGTSGESYRSVSWWREDPMVYERHLLEFRVCPDVIATGAELCWIEPANVNIYLGFILEEKKAIRKWDGFDSD